MDCSVASGRRHWRSTVNTLHVTDCGDAGTNTLRGKIGSAGVGNTIAFDQTCTITLTTGALSLTNNLVIDSSGHTTVMDRKGTANCPTLNVYPAPSLE